MLKHVQLDRKLLLLFAASLMPACIIPVGPEWQDPPGQRNQKPIILTTTPEENSRGTNAKFTIVLSDPDDTELFIRWFVDFPPFVPGVSFVGFQQDIPPSSAPGVPTTAEQTLNCIYQIPPGQPVHRIMAAISDRPFILDDGADPRATTDGIQPIELGWWLDKACEPQ